MAHATWPTWITVQIKLLGDDTLLILDWLAEKKGRHQISTSQLTMGGTVDYDIYFNIR